MPTLDMWLCLGGYELSRGPRVQAYVRGCPGAGDVFTTAVDCDCPVLDEGPYLSPEEDPAPWFEPTRDESGEFLGFMASHIVLQPVLSRSVVPVVAGGASVGPISLRPRIIEVTGYLFASSWRGMAYGERWLAAALAGTYCVAGCASDDLEVLPACDEDGYGDDQFRTLRSVGVTDGPLFIPVGDLPEPQVQEVRFVLTAGMPWLFTPAVTLIDAESVAASGGSACELVAAPGWTGDVTLSISLTAPESGDVTGLTVALNGATGGTCPEDATGAYALYRIPRIEAGDTLRIDGPSRDVVLYDSTRKLEVAGMHLIDFDGLFTWPDVVPTADVCVCVTNDGAVPVTLTVTSQEREL